MKFVNVKELKNKTSSILHYAAESGDDVIVTLRGKPYAVVHHLAEGDIEDYILLNHPKFKKKLKDAYQEYLNRETVDIAQLIKNTEKDLGRI